MVNFLKLFAVLCFVNLAQCQPNTTENFAHHMILDEAEVMRVYWNFNDTDITFEVHGRTEGWVGIGISPSGSMANSDIVVGWVKNGTAVVTDRHGGSSNGYPPIDANKDVELLEGMEVDGYTVIKFRRLIVTCDSEDIDITADTVKMIFAWGIADPVGDDLSEGDQHEFTHRGAKNILLLNPTESDGDVFPDGETHQSFDLLNDNFPIPAMDTYYNCRMFKIPDMTSKHHLVKIEPVIQTGNELNVHHMLVYQCADDVNITTVNQNTRCYGSNMPEDFLSCRSVVIAWAIGAGIFHFPKHTGYSLGSPGDPKYVVVETHYDNPEIKSDMVDSSGLRFYYTPQIRTYDAGVMEVGHGVSGYQHIIPPNAETFLDFGECSENCLAENLKAEGHKSINVFAAVLHSHLLGRKLALRHLRNGTELPYLAKDSSYDFNFQEIRVLPEERVLQSGDSMQMVCNYNSLGRKEVTVGGLSTKKEMCLSYVYYYPKMSLHLCETVPNAAALLRYFGIGRVELVGDDWDSDLNNLLIFSPPEYENKTVMEVLNSLNWDEKSADDFSLAAKSMQRTQGCYSNGNSPTGIKGSVPPPKIDIPYLAETSNCSNPTTDPDISTTRETQTVVPDTSTTQQMQTYTPNEAEKTTSSAGRLACVYTFVVACALAVLQRVI